MSDPSEYSVRHWQNELLPGLNEVQRQVLTIQQTSGKRLDQLCSEIVHAGLTEPAAIRAMLMERFGLPAENADYFTDLALKADPAAVEHDKQLLKASFGYRLYDRDLWDILLQDVDRPFYAPMAILEMPRYGPASEFLIDCYLEKGALEPLVKIYSGHTYRFAGVFAELLQHLEEAGRHDLIERLWTSVARKTRAEFFQHRPHRAHGFEAAVEEYKRLALEAYDHAIAWMTRLGRAEPAAALAEEREALREERFAALPPVADLRRIDESVFSELIARARAQGPSTLEQVAILGEMLRAFAAADIKRFASLYARTMRKLYHWNVWALAYAARGGCSDDAFEEFRAWLILQADPALIDLAIADPTAAAAHVPSDPDLPDGACTWMIEDAYLQRKGQPLEMANTDLEKPKGKEWPEDRFEALFPELVAYYATVRD